jgi:hypothetical protein
MVNLSSSALIAGKRVSRVAPSERFSISKATSAQAALEGLTFAGSGNSGTVTSVRVASSESM